MTLAAAKFVPPLGVFKRQILISGVKAIDDNHCPHPFRKCSLRPTQIPTKAITRISNVMKIVANFQPSLIAVEIKTASNTPMNGSDTKK
jgi:hypothetical protein